MKKISLITLAFLLFLIPSPTLASNGCFPTDLECGPVLSDDCDVRGNLTLAPGGNLLLVGIDICAPATLDCAGASIISRNPCNE